MQALSQAFGNDAQVSHALQRASFEVRKEKRPDYYALLKVIARLITLDCLSLRRSVQTTTQGVPSNDSVIAYHRLVMATHHRYEYALRIH